MKERQEKGNFSLFMISIEMPVWTAIFPGSHKLQAKVFPLFTFQMLLLSFQSHIIFNSQLFSPGLLPIHIRITEDCSCHCPRGSAENQLEWAEPAPLNTSWSLNLWMWSLYVDIPCGSDGLMTGQSAAEVSYEIKENVNMPQMAGFLLRFSSVTSGRAAFSSSEAWWYKNYKNMLSVSE